MHRGAWVWSTIAHGVQQAAACAYCIYLSAPDVTTEVTPYSKWARAGSQKAQLYTDITEVCGPSSVLAYLHVIIGFDFTHYY